MNRTTLTDHNLGCTSVARVCRAEQIRVAVVTNFPHDPNNPFGGTQSVSVHLVQGLSNLKGLDLHIVTEDAKCSTPKESIWGKVRIHRLPRQGSATLTNAIGPGRRQMIRYLKRLAPDVIHAHDVYGLMVKGLPIPRVFTIHGQIYKDTRFSGGRFPRLRSWLWKRIELTGWADQPHVISISPYVREQLTGIVTGNIYNIDNPIGENCFNLDRREEPGRIFCAAWISPRKNTLMLVRSFAKLLKAGVKAKLRLSGTGDIDYLNSVSNYIHKEGLEDSIKLLGRVNYEVVQEEMSRAAVFTLVSLEENSPMAIEEAMAVGVPVVTSNRCGMPYIIRDGESGFLVDPNNPNDIVRRLRQLLRNDELRRSMGAKGREIALDRFHPAKVAARTRDVYLRAIHDFKEK